MIHYLNIPRIVCQRLLGRDHAAHHRTAVGGIIMAFGVGIAQLSHGVELVIVKAAIDLVGYTFHGLGCVPVIEWLLDSQKEG